MKYEIALFDNQSERIAEGTLTATKEGMNKLLDIIFDSDCTAIVRKADEVQ